MAQIRNDELKYEEGQTANRPENRPGAFLVSFFPIIVVLSLLAGAFSAYVAIDEDLRTLVWQKWTQEVEYVFPGEDGNFTFDQPAEPAIEGSDLQTPQ
jgi:hypothetical protein